MAERHYYYETGHSLTGILAGILSWMLNHSVGWVFVHAFLGWVYLLYAAIARTDEVEAILTGLFG